MRRVREFLWLQATLLRRFWFIPLSFAPVWVCMYWLILDTASPITAISQSRISAAPDVNRAEGMLVSRHICATREVRVIAERFFIDGVKYPLPATLTTIARGCHDYQGMVDIPHSLPAGPYSYEVTLDVPVNPLVHVTQSLDPLPLLIGARGTPAPTHEQGAVDRAFAQPESGKPGTGVSAANSK